MTTLSYAFWVVIVIAALLHSQRITAFMQHVQWWLAWLLVTVTNMKPATTY